MGKFLEDYTSNGELDDFLVNIVYTVIDFFLKTDNTVMERIDAIGIGGRMDYGQASAMAWVYFLCVIVALGIVSLIISREVYYYE